MEWGAEPFLVFSPGQDGGRRVFLYSVHDGDRLYLAAIIGDLSPDPESDTFAVYFDTNDNSGDPDNEDRLFQTARNGTLSMWSGVGDNSDGDGWEPTSDGQSWTAFSSEIGSNSWSVEMAIDLAAEMPQIIVGPGFGSLFHIQFTGSEGSWPEEADNNDAGTWQPILIGPC